jgi:hypothetical protein
MRWKQRRDAGLICRMVDGEVVLLDTDANYVHRLNRTAGLIWTACGCAQSVPALVRMLEDGYSMDAATLRRDVVETVERLHALGLLEAERGAEGTS